MRMCACVFQCVCVGSSADVLRICSLIITAVEPPSSGEGERISFCYVTKGRGFLACYKVLQGVGGGGGELEFCVT